MNKQRIIVTNFANVEIYAIIIKNTRIKRDKQTKQEKMHEERKKKEKEESDRRGRKAEHGIRQEK